MIQSPPKCAKAPCSGPDFLSLSCITCTEHDPLAIESVLGWCVEEYNTSIRNGVTTITRQDSTNNFTGSGNGGKFTGPIFNTKVEFPCIRSFDSPPKYSVNLYTYYIVSNYLRKTLSGAIQTPAGLVEPIKSLDAAEAFWQRFKNDSESQKEAQELVGVNKILKNIAVSMTNTVRETGHTTYALSDHYEDYAKAIDTALREQNFVRVQWGWIAAPLALLLLSLLFVLTTIIQTRTKANQSKICGSSSLSTLLALSDELHRDVGGIRSLSENENGYNTSEYLLSEI
ncbi:hypothetical protein EAF04_005246 [Stromatinia cepivora]|nr:hypothetical protein EAF04_005246 [Stromatinia cepivora]